MSEAQLGRSYAGFTCLAALPDEELQALVRSLLADMEEVSSSVVFGKAVRDTS